MADIIAVIMQWLNLNWVAEQALTGNGLPFLTWTLFVFGVGFMGGFFVHKLKHGYVPKFMLLRGMDVDTARAALDSFNAEGMIKVEPHEVLFSEAVNNKGIFEFDEPNPDYVGSGSLYRLTNGWRRYLGRPWVKNRLVKIANK